MDSCGTCRHYTVERKAPLEMGRCAVGDAAVTGDSTGCPFNSYLPHQTAEG